MSPEEIRAEMPSLALTDVRIAADHKAIVLDAVGTLIYPHPPVDEVYQQCGARHGCDVPKELVGQRFQNALQAADWNAAGSRGQIRTWREIVGHVFRELDDTRCQPLFDDLWNYFGQPHAWCLFPDVVPMWNGWTRGGLSDRHRLEL